MLHWVTMARSDNLPQLPLSIYCGVIRSVGAAAVPQPRRPLYVSVIMEEALIAGLVVASSLTGQELGHCH